MTGLFEKIIRNKIEKEQTEKTKYVQARRSCVHHIYNFTVKKLLFNDIRITLLSV